MKKLALMLAFALCAILGLTLDAARAAPPTPTATHVQKPALLVMAVAHAQPVIVSVNLARAVAVPDELAYSVAVPTETAPRPGNVCRFNPRWHDVPIDSIRMRPWRNQIKLPYQVRPPQGPLHVDPGRSDQKEG